jgi:UDP-galactopyranose mutase
MYLKVNYPNVLPHGRLGQFEYISMAEAIEQSLALAWRLMRDLI